MRSYHYKIVNWLYKLLNSDQILNKKLTYAYTGVKTICNVGLIDTNNSNIVLDTSMFPAMERDIRIEVGKIKIGKLSVAIWTHYYELECLVEI